MVGLQCAVFDAVITLQKRIKELWNHQLDDRQLIEKTLLIQDIREQNLLLIRLEVVYLVLILSFRALLTFREFKTFYYWIMIESKNKLQNLFSTTVKL